jgi:glycine hydroxymethyltransferase
MLVDLRPLGLAGRDAETSLERAGITCNKNGIPFDPQGPTVTSGIRLGTPAATTRGFGANEFRTIGGYIAEVLRALGRQPAENRATEARVHEKVRELCMRFPIYRAFGTEQERVI